MPWNKKPKYLVYEHFSPVFNRNVKIYEILEVTICNKTGKAENEIPQFKLCTFKYLFWCKLHKEYTTL